MERKIVEANEDLDHDSDFEETKSFKSDDSVDADDRPSFTSPAPMMDPITMPMNATNLELIPEDEPMRTEPEPAEGEDPSTQMVLNIGIRPKKMRRNITEMVGDVDDVVENTPDEPQEEVENTLPDNEITSELLAKFDVETSIAIYDHILKFKDIILKRHR